MRLAPLIVLLAFASAACATKPVRTTTVHRAGLEGVGYEEYVTRRTDALQRMGGVFADRDKASAKAVAEATRIYGEPTPEVSTTWSWGHGAGREAAQADLIDNLETLERDGQREK